MSDEGSGSDKSSATGSENAQQTPDDYSRDAQAAVTITDEKSAAESARNAAAAGKNERHFGIGATKREQRRHERRIDMAGPMRCGSE